MQSLGGLIDDTELVDGLVFTHKAVHAAGGPSRVENAKIGLIQFQLSSPKTNVIISSMHQIVIKKNTHTHSHTDGEYSGGKRLLTNGSHIERREELPFGHVQQDQEGRVQRPLDPKVNPPRRRQRCFPLPPCQT